MRELRIRNNTKDNLKILISAQIRCCGIEHLKIITDCNVSSMLLRSEGIVCLSFQETAFEKSAWSVSLLCCINDDHITTHEFDTAFLKR